MISKVWDGSTIFVNMQENDCYVVAEYWKTVKQTGQQIKANFVKDITRINLKYQTNITNKYTLF